MFKKLEVSHGPDPNVPTLGSIGEEGSKTIKSIKPFSGGIELPSSKSQKSLVDEENKGANDSNKNKKDYLDQLKAVKYLNPFSKLTGLGKLTKQDTATDATLAASSKWKAARKARILGKMVIQKKEILNRDYGIDESTADKVEHHEKIRCILPNNIYIKYWHRFFQVLTFYLGLVYIYRVCLLSYEKDVLFYLEIVMQTCFLIDLFLNFFLAYYDQDDLVTDLKSIILHYCFTFFIFDLMAALPVNLIVMSIDYKPGDEGHRILRLLSAARIIKFFIGIITYEGWKDIPFFAKRSPTIIRLIKILVLLIYFVHLSACIFVLLAKIDGSNRSWIFLNETQDLAPLELYIYAIYWSTQTIVTVGFGDITINSNPERLMALVLMYIGSAVYSFMISNLGAVVEEADTFETSLKAKINSFKTLAKETNLPEELVQKVKKFIESNHKHNPRASMNDQSFINELPFTLKAQLLFNINAKVIQNVPFLKDKDVDFILKMAPNLKPIELLHKEILFRENEYPEDVFFLTSGIIHLKGKSGIPLYVVSENEMFGDIEVLQNITRITTAQAQTRCSLFSIEKEMFNEVLNSYPDVRDNLMNDANEKKKRLLDLKKKGRDDTSCENNIIVGSQLRTNALSAADYANRMYEKPTDKFEREISVYLEKGVGKKWKMRYVKRLSKRMSRENQIGIAYESIGMDKESEAPEGYDGQLKRNEEAASEIGESQMTHTSGFKNETTLIEEHVDMELVNKKKEELETQYFGQAEKLGSELLTTIDTLEECNNNMKKQESKYERLATLISAIKEKQNQINGRIEVYQRKLDMSGKTTIRSESLTSNLG